MIKIAVYGKGGIGKSTTVSNVAAALAEQESAFGGSIDFEATVGTKLDTLLHETTADNGLLAHHLFHG